MGRNRHGPILSCPQKRTDGRTFLTCQRHCTLGSKAIAAYPPADLTIDVIGKTMLSDMLEGREKINSELQKIIDKGTGPWGINVISVEVKDVLIPSALEDAMSMQAQAERERQARVIPGDSER